MKRVTLNGKLTNLFVELLVVADKTIFDNHKRFIQSENLESIVVHMKIYYAHFVNMINQRFQNSLIADANLKVQIKLVNFVFLIVSFLCIDLKCFFIDY